MLEYYYYYFWGRGGGGWGGYVLNWPVEVFVIKKLKSGAVDMCYSDLNREEIGGTCYKEEMQKINQKESRIKK